MLCGSLERRGVWGRMDTCIHMAELLCSSPETITILLINCVSGSVVSDSLPRYGQQPTRLLCPWDSPGKNTGVGSHSLLQGIFPTQGSNAGLPHFWQILYHLSHQGSLQCKIKSFLKKKLVLQWSDQHHLYCFKYSQSFISGSVCTHFFEASSQGIVVAYVMATVWSSCG